MGTGVFGRSHGQSFAGTESFVVENLIFGTGEVRLFRAFTDVKHHAGVGAGLDLPVETQIEVIIDGLGDDVRMRTALGLGGQM